MGTLFESPLNKIKSYSDTLHDHNDCNFSPLSPPPSFFLRFRGIFWKNHRETLAKKLFFVTKKSFDILGKKKNPEMSDCLGIKYD